MTGNRGAAGEVREEGERERKGREDRWRGETERDGGLERCVARGALGVMEEKGRERNGGREQGREAVIKSDCIPSRMSQESRISGDVKPCLTPQLDNCGCGS